MMTDTEEIPAENSASAAGFFTRGYAYITDCLFLAIFIGLPVLFLSHILQLGSYLPHITTLIYILYFGISEGPIGKGQSLGKKAFKIQVINSNGEAPSYRQSFIRATALAAMLFFDSIITVNNSMPMPIQILILLTTLILTSAYVASTYLYVFNVKARRTVYDLLADCFVIEADSLFDKPQHNLAMVHKAIVGVIFIVGLSTSAYFSYNLAIQERPPINPEIAKIESDPRVKRFQLGTQIQGPINQPLKKSIRATVHVTNRKFVNDADFINEQSNKIASLVANNEGFSDLKIEFLHEEEFIFMTFKQKKEISIPFSDIKKAIKESAAEKTP